MTQNKPEQVTEARSVQFDLPEGVPPLSSLYLYIAGSCNLACRHCWITPNYIPNGKGGQFSQLAHIQKAISQALPLGLSEVKLTGGEPTLHPQFRELVNIVDQAGLEITMETNGILIDASLARFLKDKPNFKFLSVSLDGADAATHEALRLIPGCFDQAITAIQNLVEVGLSPQIICTLHQGNRDQVSAMVRLANDLDCQSIKFNHVQSSGRGQVMAETEGISTPDIIEIYNYIENVVAPTSQIPVHFDIPLAFHPPKTLIRKAVGQCSVLNILGMLSGGELSLCGIGVTVPELIYGNINEDDLADIWCNAPGIKLLRQIVPEGFTGICGRCIHRDFCLGACVANTYAATRSLSSSYYFCTEADESGLFPDSRLTNP
jgi:SynChlorMet cassette radical SAM/SPASM protein ScmF